MKLRSELIDLTTVSGLIEIPSHSRLRNFGETKLTAEGFYEGPIGSSGHTGGRNMRGYVIRLTIGDDPKQSIELNDQTVNQLRYTFEVWLRDKEKLTKDKIHYDT